jgi:hypothetical protein
MVAKAEHQHETKLKGVVKISPEGNPLEGVLIKDSSGEIAKSNRKGEFEIHVVAEEISGTFVFALCAKKEGFQLWVDWGVLDSETIEHGLTIYLTPGTDKLKLTGMGYYMGQATRCGTGQGIRASVRLDARPYQATDATGHFGPFITSSGGHTLWAKASNVSAKSWYKEVPLASTAQWDGDDFCL